MTFTNAIQKHRLKMSEKAGIVGLSVSKHCVSKPDFSTKWGKTYT